MPIPAGVGRIVLQGNFRGGLIWETGWWGQGDLFSTDAGCQQQANSVRDSLQTNTFKNGIAQFWDAATQLNKVTVYGYPTGGTKSTVMADSTVTGVVGSATGSNPLQACLVATLLTGSPGRSNRGRMYWPASGVQMGSNQANDGLAGQLATLTYALLAPTDGSGPGPIVVSQKHGSFKPVTAVRVDTIIDIQRRRAQGQTPLGSHTVNS